MSRPVQPVFAWDEGNTGHLEEFHPDIAPGHVDSIFERRVLQLPNTGGRTGNLFIGIDRKGRLLAVPADSLGGNVWRPRTAHQARSAWQRKLYFNEEDTGRDAEEATDD